MKNQQGAPEALRPIQRYKIGYHTDEWGMRSSTPSGIPDRAGAWVRYEDHVAALVDAQQPAPSAAVALSDDLRDRLVAISGAIADQDDRAAQAMLREILAAPQPSPTPQADSQPAPIDMVLHCPKCGLQHIDEPDWQNDPQLGAIRYANAQQRIDTSGDREAQQSHHEPVQVLLRDGGMASGGHAEQPVQEVQLPATAIHEANKSMHVVSSGNGRFTVLQGQQNGQPSSEVQGLPQERNRRLEEDQSGRGESGGTSPKQSAARDEAIRLDARGVSGAPESSRADLQHLREGRASEAQEGPSIAGSLPCNGQDSGRAVLSLQHDAGLRERRLNVASQRDQVSCEAPLRAPIHRSHLCRPEDGGCGHIWRPADVPTNGVAAVKTTGKADSPIAARAPADSQPAPVRDYPPLTIAEARDLTCMLAGAPWPDEMLPELLQLLAIYDNLRSDKARPVDPASLPSDMAQAVISTGRNPAVSEQTAEPTGFWEWVRQAYRAPESTSFTVHNMAVAYRAGRDADRAARAQADSQPAPVRDESAARDECKRQWLAEDEDCNLLEAYDRGWKDRAASAPADSVTAPAGGEIDRLRAALVYVAFALHGKPQYMLAEGIALIDGDTVRVSRDGWTVEASINPARATPPAQAADSVLEDAARLLRQILAASQDGDSDTHLSAHFVSRIETITKAGGAA